MAHPWHNYKPLKGPCLGNTLPFSRPHSQQCSWRHTRQRARTSISAGPPDAGWQGFLERLRDFLPGRASRKSQQQITELQQQLEVLQQAQVQLQNKAQQQTEQIEAHGTSQRKISSTAATTFARLETELAGLRDSQSKASDAQGSVVEGFVRTNLRGTFGSAYAGTAELASLGDLLDFLGRHVPQPASRKWTEGKVAKLAKILSDVIIDLPPRLFILASLFHVAVVCINHCP